jgi:peptide/nickel transport system ATP-binding protein
MSRPILKTEGLNAFYQLDVLGARSTVKAVNNINISIEENEVYGIAGESGCGKTTLLKTLYATVDPPLRLMGGRVVYTVNGREVEVTALDQEERRRLRWEFISYIPQGSMSVLNPVVKIKRTYRDFLESHVRGETRNDAFRRAKEHIEVLGLPDTVLDAYPHQLSGGMRQRVTIALAAILHPRIMIADEPTTALDVVVQRGVVQLLKSIQSTLSNTIILVTHDMGVHANVSDRIGIMYAGRMVEEAPTAEVFGEPRHPYTRFLIKSLPHFGDRSRRESVPGAPPSLSHLPPGCPFHPRCPQVMDVCKEKNPGFTMVAPLHRAACWLLGDEIDADDT